MANKKNLYLVTYEYNYSDPRTTRVKADSSSEAAHIVEHRRLGNYVTDVKLLMLGN